LRIPSRKRELVTRLTSPEHVKKPANHMNGNKSLQRKYQEKRNHKRVRVLMSESDDDNLCRSPVSVKLEGDWMDTVSTVENVVPQRKVLELVAGRCLHVQNVTGPNSPSTDRNSHAISLQFAICRASEY
jgi:hypothetical protein